jgi:hypothetical protein
MQGLMMLAVRFETPVEGLPITLDPERQGWSKGCSWMILKMTQG